MYIKLFKRIFDFFIALTALILLSPLFLVLIVLGTIAMRGNPFFVQPRPGRKDKNGNEVIFNLIKFRTMSNKRDEDGNLLPDEMRLNKYGRILRSTSLDEIPELFNILTGSVALVGPRPLLVSYLSLYSEKQRHRHDVRPGLTGYAQVYGRNAISWEEKFEKDIYYVENISFWLDLKILFKTVQVVFCREGISSETSATMEIFTGNNKENDLYEEKNDDINFSKL